MDLTNAQIKLLYDLAAPEDAGMINGGDIQFVDVGSHGSVQVSIPATVTRSGRRLRSKVMVSGK